VLATFASFVGEVAKNITDQSTQENAAWLEDLSLDSDLLQYLPHLSPADASVAFGKQLLRIDQLTISLRSLLTRPDFQLKEEVSQRLKKLAKGSYICKMLMFAATKGVAAEPSKLSSQDLLDMKFRPN